MCDPLTIAGIVATVGSTAMNTVASNRTDSARESALAMERMRQDRLDQEAQALNLRSQDRYDNFGEQREQRELELADYYTAPPAQAPPEAAMPASTSGIVVREENRQRDKAREFTDKQGAALADLRSFGDVLGGIGRETGRDASMIGQIGGFKRGSQNVLGLELAGADQSANGMKTFADILGGVGTLATGAGLSGASLGGLFGAKAPLNILPAAARFTPSAAGAMTSATAPRLASLY